VFALNTLPGILVYAFLVTMLWSVGINGDNAVDAIVAPHLSPIPCLKCCGGDGRPALAIYHGLWFFSPLSLMSAGRGRPLRSRSCVELQRAGLSQSQPSFAAHPDFQINEPIFFGLPIVLNPIFMAPYILNALILTAGSYLLMHWHLINKPFVNVPWTTPPIIGHYLVSGGDWRAAVWGPFPS